VSDEAEVEPTSTDDAKFGLSTEQKAEIIFEFINGYRGDVAFDEFFSYNDLGVPMAVMIVNDLITLNQSGLDVMNETWKDLCNVLNYVDPEYSYVDLDDLLVRSGHLSAQNLEDDRTVESWMLQHYASNPGLDPGLTEDELRTFAEASDEEIQRNVAQNPSAPTDVLISLSKSSNSEVRCGVARNSSVSYETLFNLANDSESRVRIAVAENDKAHLAILESLVNDSDPEVRSTLARNPSLNEGLIENLAKDRENVVRRNVAKNTSATSEVLVAMTKDDDVWVRRNVASNPSTSNGTLISMMRMKTYVIV
jgi:hypothetical protein